MKYKSNEMKNKKIIIGSRASKLALIYAEKAREKNSYLRKRFWN